MGKLKDVFNKFNENKEEAAVVSKVKAMYKKSYDSKASKHELWSKCMDAYKGDYFKKNLPEYKAQELSNFVFSTVETVKPVMLANSPKFLALPHREEFYEKSFGVQSIIDYEWQREKMFTKLGQYVTNTLIYGTVVVMLPWVASDNRGLGNVKPILLSPFNIVVDPMATCVEDAEYMGFAVYKNVGEVIKAYPNKAEELKRSCGAIQDEYLAFGKDTENVNADTNILYIELYLKDYSTEVTIEEEDGKKYEVKKMKYPNGRRIIVAGDVLLEDSQNPYEDGRFPFTMWKCYDIPGEFWGISEVQMIMSPQEYICEINNSIIESAQLTSNPIWIVDKNAGIDKHSLTNRKGLVVRKNPGTEVKREQPPALPAYIQNIVMDLKRDIEQISGVYDVTRGEKPAGITAAAAIQALNEQAQGRIKLKLQCLEQMLGELGSMWLSRIQQFWVTKRSVRIIGTPYTSNQATGMQSYGLPDGRNMSFASIDRDDVDGDYDIIMVAGSTMQVNKQARLQTLVQLAQTPAEDGMPMIDRQTVLENADINNVREVMERFNAIKQQQQEQAMAEQQAAQEQQMMAEQEAMAQEQAKAEEERQIKMQEDEMNHQRELEKKMMDTKGKMALQNNQSVLQSKAEEGNSESESGQSEMTLEELVKLIMSMPEEERNALLKENPNLIELLKAYELKQGEQSV